MNRYIVVNTKAKNSAVWETIGDNYTPSKGEVCIIVPPTSEITKDEAAVRTSLIEQHYFTQEEKLAIIALINDENSNEWSILSRNKKAFQNKISHFNENGTFITITDETTGQEIQKRITEPFTTDEQIYLTYKINGKMNNFTKQFVLHNIEGIIETVKKDETNDNYTYLTLKDINGKYKVLSDDYKYIESKHSKIRLIPLIETDYYDTEILPSTYNINTNIKSNKQKLLEKINLVPTVEEFNAQSSEQKIHYCVSKAVLFNDPKADGNLIISTENIDYTGVAPISIKIGDGTNLFRDLPVLTSGNVQGDWAATDPTNPAYIKNKPILNDDLFQQSEEKTLLIPSTNLYDEQNQLLVVGLLDLFNINYNNNYDTSNLLTPTEKNALIYIIKANGYDLKDYTNVNTKIFTQDTTNITKIINKLKNFNKVGDIQISESNLVYISNLLTTGSANIELNERELLLTQLSQMPTTEDGIPWTITVKDQSNQKIFHQEEYIKISDHYFHPNDLLIYNDNNWGYYEIHMFGQTAPFYSNEITHLEHLINNVLTFDEYLNYTTILQTLLKTKINNYISESTYKNYLLNKLNYIVPDVTNNETIINNLISNLNTAIKEYNKSNEKTYSVLDLEKNTLDQKIQFIVDYLNYKISIIPDLNSTDKENLIEEINDNDIINLEVNKQPRYYFYKSNILKSKEKQTLSQIIKDTLYVYNNRFNLKEQNILITFIDGNSLTDEQYLELKQGLATELINKIRLNADITVNNGKNFLIEHLQLENKVDENGIPYFEYNLTEDERIQLLKQVQISKNALGNKLDEIELNDITEELLNDLIQELSLDKENTILEGFEGENIYYEINNEIILNPVDRAIYMRLNSLKGYLKQTKNLEIIFHYKNRSLNNAFLSDLISDWNENDPENPGYIAHRFIYQDNNSLIHYDLWFYKWLTELINSKISEFYDTDLKDRIAQIEKDIEDLKKRCDDLENRIAFIEGNNERSENYFLNRLKTLIVSQPERPVLSRTFFPKIWICTDVNSGYGLVYWRQGGEDDAGHYDELAAQNVKWTPISAIWSPDTLTN